jgi:predicted DNA-binding protein
MKTIVKTLSVALDSESLRMLEYTSEHLKMCKGSVVKRAIEIYYGLIMSQKDIILSIPNKR